MPSSTAENQDYVSFPLMHRAALLGALVGVFVGGCLPRASCPEPIYTSLVSGLFELEPDEYSRFGEDGASVAELALDEGRLTIRYADQDGARVVETYEVGKVE